MECLSVIGWIFTFALTYGGFATLFVGTLWNASICEKLADFKAKWRELRQQAAEEAAAAKKETEATEGAVNGTSSTAPASQLPPV